MLSQRIENDTSPERPYIAQIYKEAGSTRYSGLGFVPTNTIDTRQEDGTGHIGVLGILNGRCTGYIAPIKHDRVIQIDTIIGDSMEQILTEAGILTETNICEPVFGNNDFKQFPNGIQLRPHMIEAGDKLIPSLVGKGIDEGLYVTTQLTRNDSGEIHGDIIMTINGERHERTIKGDSHTIMHELDKEFYTAKLQTLNTVSDTSKGLVDNRLLGSETVEDIQFDPRTIAMDVLTQEIDIKPYDKWDQIYTVKATGYEYKVNYNGEVYIADSQTHDRGICAISDMDLYQQLCEYTEDDIRDIIYHGGRERLIKKAMNPAHATSLEGYDGLVLTRKITREYHEGYGDEKYTDTLVYTQELYDKNDNMAVYIKQNTDNTYDGVILVGHNFDDIDNDCWSANFISDKRYTRSEWSDKIIYTTQINNTSLSDILQTVTDAQRLQFGIDPEVELEEIDWSFAEEQDMQK